MPTGLELSVQGLRGRRFPLRFDKASGRRKCTLSTRRTAFPGRLCRPGRADLRVSYAVAVGIGSFNRRPIGPREQRPPAKFPRAGDQPAVGARPAV